MLRTRLIPSVLAIAAAAALPGCVGYDSWPPVQQDTLRNDPDAPPMDEIIMAGVGWMIDNRPPKDYHGPVAVNIPTGVSPRHYRRIVSKSHERATPLTRETAALPTYHVKAVRVRGTKAEITVVGPAADMPPGADGTPVTQGYTLYVEGGWRPWRVVRWRAWSIGIMEPPSPNYLDDAEAAAGLR